LAVIVELKLAVKINMFHAIGKIFPSDFGFGAGRRSGDSVAEFNTVHQEGLNLTCEEDWKNFLE
jgi:hypothetical protein